MAFGRRCIRLMGIATALLTIFLNGCAKTDSSPMISLSAPSRLEQPTQLILVVTNDLPNHIAGSVPQVVDAVLAKELSYRLEEPGVHVTIRQSMVDARAPLAGALLVHCAVTHMRIGNQALRMTVGFGAGQFNLVTRTSLLDLRGASATELVDFQSRSTTGSMPGSGLGLAFAVATGQVIGIAGGGAGLFLDVRQTASQRSRQIADSVSGQLRTYFQSKGWVNLAASPLVNSALIAKTVLAPPRPL